MVNKEFYINFFCFIKQIITVNLKQGGVSCKIGINNYNMIEIIVKKNVVNKFHLLKEFVRVKKYKIWIYSNFINI